MQPLDYIKERLHFSYGIQDGTQGGSQDVTQDNTCMSSAPC